MVKDPNGKCDSKIGRMRLEEGEQTINLGRGSFCINTKKGIVHELLHGWGITHEHQRHDRDNYVTGE